MRKRNLKKLAVLLMVATFALTTFVFVGAADELGGFFGSGDAELSRSDDFARSGDKSLKIVREQDNDTGYQGPRGRINLEDYIDDNEGKYEVSFSLYQDELDDDKYTATWNIENDTKDYYHSWVDGYLNGYQQAFTRGQWIDYSGTLDFTDKDKFGEGEITKAALYFEHINASTFYVDNFKIVKDGEVLLELDFEDEAGGEDDIDEAYYNFEDDVQGWTADEGIVLSIDNENVGKGKGSLKAVLPAGANEYNLVAPLEGIVNDAVFTCMLYIPEGADINGMQIFSQDANWKWASQWINGETGKWLEASYTIPAADAEDDSGEAIGVMPFAKFGIQFSFHSELEEDLTVYLDSADLDPRPVTEEPTPTPSTGDEDKEEDEEPVQTGYASTIGFVLLAAASTGVLVSKKKK